ncbi:3-deoxy-D-manno-octulosonic acid transferase [Paraglaciecola polaris]|uniref:3-deoxy-D-manno-octulosonic acid transferase n=1 Tax=Paraglaciecola polaris LMG 21857 TaxID=1129793 RepID=K7AJS7_9ALTE|nr:3-deoxy-D-manno-octulosonic acid transferase [Paraglaciecola polaris]GAC35600.1 3-deoxy-D-manno-octulosonic-acid transferase [Paraglaciecola polaris LMG 21857]
MNTSFQPKPKEKLSLWGYTLLLWTLLPFAFLHFCYQYLAKKSVTPKARIQRFGLRLSTASAGGLLIHCVSVGEVVAAANVIKAIRTIQPDLPITLTTTTVTGAKQANSLFNDSITHCYLPLDTGWMMRRLLKRAAPSQVLITEVELWPNLIDQCWRQDIPISVINARMTDRSARSYGKISALFQPMLHKLSKVCAQGERDFNNYQQLGTPNTTLVLTNNIKFEQPVSTESHQQSTAFAQRFNIHKRSIIVAGSTHAPEEEVLLDAYQRVLAQQPNSLLIIVPRHPQRFEDVYQICLSSGLNCLRSSDAQPCNDTSQVLLVDEMGKLQALYGLADIAFVGGSIADRGGHNALEPAAFEVPILMGPHRYNNPAICQILTESGALFEGNDAAQISRQILTWFNDESAREYAGQAGKRVLKENSGAVNATLVALGFA